MSNIIERLKEPFPPDVVSWRVGSMNKEKTKGMALAYIDARDVMNRLDEVCGPAGWMDRYEFHGTRTICYLSIRIPTTANPDGEWITKGDGAGDSDVEAEKGSISDSFKRAAVKWGIGRYLYDLPSPWVAVNQYKQIEESERPKLRALLAKDAKPTPAPPRQDNTPKPKTTANDIKLYVDAFRLVLSRCEYESEVRGAWKEHASKREQLGIDSTSETYELLAGLCRDRIEEIGLSAKKLDGALVP